MASVESDEPILEESGAEHLRFYNFNKDGIDINFIDEDPRSDEITLDLFYRNKVKNNTKGSGKIVLLKSLLLLRKKIPRKTTILLSAVPHNSSLLDAQRKLNAYYTSLGFNKIEDSTQDFTANIDELIQKLKTGGTKRRRRRRKRYTKKY